MLSEPKTRMIAAVTSGMIGMRLSIEPSVTTTPAISTPVAAKMPSFE